MKEKRQVIPCYAGLSNIHITPDGKSMPCCIQGYKMPMGNLREMDYSIDKILASKRAKEVRKYIRKKIVTVRLQTRLIQTLFAILPAYSR